MVISDDEESEYVPGDEYADDSDESSDDDEENDSDEENLVPEATRGKIKFLTSYVLSFNFFSGTNSSPLKKQAVVYCKILTIIYFFEFPFGDR